MVHIRTPNSNIEAGDGADLFAQIGRVLADSGLMSGGDIVAAFDNGVLSGDQNGPLKPEELRQQMLVAITSIGRLSVSIPDGGPR